MGEFVNWLNTAGRAFVAFAGPMLIQSSVLIALLAALDFVLRKRIKAVVRYWIWLLVLAKLLLPPSLASPTSLVSWVGNRLPATTLISPGAPGGTAAPGCQSEKMTPEGGGPTRLEGLLQPMNHRHELAPAQAGDARATFPTRSEPAALTVLPTWQALVLLVWLVAVVLMGVLLIQRAAFVHGLMAQAQAAPDSLRALLEQCRRQMAVRGEVGIRQTSLATSPAVCGLRRPVILIPEAMIRQLETPQLRSVLLHELAHLRRGDLWINLLQTLLQIVYLYHPLLWWANARIRAVREQAVDETVLAALGEEAEEYPRTLLSISRLAFGPPALSLRLLGVVESQKALTVRIRHMVSRPFPQNARVGLPGLAAFVVVALVLLPMARGTERGQRGTSNLMDRLQKEDDPELAELIRTAVANHKGASEKEILEITERVTQSRAQILLLDEQIEEVDRKIESTPGPEETRRELLQTREELEAKRMAEIADLREAIGILPRLPFDKQPTAKLNAWVSLQIVDQQVVVLDAVKEFSDYWAMTCYKMAGLLSVEETLKYLQGRLKDKRNLPLRIDIHYKPETNIACQELRERIVSLARETNAEMQTEVRLQAMTWPGPGVSPFFLRDGKITALYSDPVRRPDGGPNRLFSGAVAPTDLEQHILWRLLCFPENVPLTFRIEYDETSAQLAKQVADTARTVAKRVGLAELVDVAGTLVEPVPETVFLGRWQAILAGEMQTLEIQPDGACHVIMGKGTEVIKAGSNVSGTWLPISDGIIIDIHDKTPDTTRFVYGAAVNAEGRLVVNKGRVNRRGNFYFHGPSQTIFEKAK